MRRFVKVGAGGALVGLGSAAMAAVPESFSSAVTTATTDSVSMVGSLIGIAAAVVVAKIALAYVKSLKTAAK